MGTRERWVDDEEAEANGRVAAAVLKSVRDTPGVIVSGKPHRWTSVVIHLQYRIPPSDEKCQNPNASENEG